MRRRTDPLQKMRTAINKSRPGSQYVVMNREGLFLNVVPNMTGVVPGRLGTNPPPYSLMWQPTFSLKPAPKSFGVCLQHVAIYKLLTGRDDVFIASPSKVTYSQVDADVPVESQDIHKFTALARLMGMNAAQKIIAVWDELDPDYHHFLASAAGGAKVELRKRIPRAIFCESYVLMGKGDTTISKLLLPKNKIHNVSEMYQLVGML